jgi:hypothetical protein
MENQMKFTEEELQSVKTIRDKNTAIVLDLGQNELETFTLSNRLKELETEKQSLQSNYLQLRMDEQQLVQELNKKYGAGTVDIESGVFIPNK